MIKSIDEYLLKLKKELSGYDPATVQAALSDSEEHLRKALRNDHEIHPDSSESDLLQEIIKNYGAPDKIAAIYKETGSRTVAAISRNEALVNLVVFICTLFTSVYFLSQGIILLFWNDMNGDGFSGLENGYIFFTWALLCLMLGTALCGFAGYVWTSYRKRGKDLPLITYLIPMFPFVVQGIVLLRYWLTRTAGSEQREAGTALLMGIMSLSLALILLLIWIWIMVRRHQSLAKVSPVSRDNWRREKGLPLLIYLFFIFPLVIQSIALLLYWGAKEAKWDRIGTGITLSIGILSLLLAFILLIAVILARRQYIKDCGDREGAGKSIDEYLLKLKKELTGYNPAIVQDALSNSEEHLIEALRSARDIHPDQSEDTILQEIIKNYGTPEEVAATYKEIESPKVATMRKRATLVSLVVFISTLFTSVLFLGQGILLLFWNNQYWDGLGGLERGNTFLFWVIACLVLAIALAVYAWHIWISYRKREKDLPLQIYLIPVFPFVAQGIALLYYRATLSEAKSVWQSASGDLLPASILSFSLAFILLLIFVVTERQFYLAEVIQTSRKKRKILIISLISLIAIGISAYLLTTPWSDRGSALKGPIKEQWIAHYNGSADNSDVAHSSGTDGLNDLGDDSEYVKAIAADSSGNVYITGSSYSGIADNDYTTIKYDGEGNQLWVALYNGPASSRDHARAIFVDKLGNVYVTGGATVSGDFNAGGSGFDYDSTTIKYDTNGNQLWIASYSSPGKSYDETSAIVVDDSGNVYVTGRCQDDNRKSGEYVTIKYDSDGNQLWVTPYKGSASGLNGARDIAIDSQGNVYVSGYSKGSDITGDYDYATIKYDSNGNQLWVARYNNISVSGRDVPEAISVDKLGNVYVTGSSEGFLSQRTFTTVKYDRDGKELWVKSVSGDGPDSQAEAKDIVVDEAGNAYVTGYSEGFYTGPDYFTVKYNSDGNQLWEARYNGPASGYDSAQAIAIDDMGNIYVTGESSYRGNDTDATTICYSTAGKELWVACYNGQSSSYDKAQAIAVDNIGNVYVAGFSNEGNTGQDCLVIKYTPIKPQISEQVKQIMENTASAILGATSYKFNIDESVSVDSVSAVAPGAIQEGTTTMGISITGIVDNVNKAMYMLMTMNLDGKEIAVEEYIIGEWLYMKNNVSETKDQWKKMRLTPEIWETQNQIEQQIELMGSGGVDLIGSGIVDGVDCYKLKATPDAGLLIKYLLQQPGTDGSRELEEALLSSSVSVEFTQWVAKDSSLLLKSDGRLNMKLSPENISSPAANDIIRMTMDVVANTVAYDYNQPVIIELPVEAYGARETSVG